jgi:predicted transposase/invertase (TIGR01784 family)
MFVLKNLAKLERIPIALKEKIFLKLFEAAEIAKLKPEEYKQYEDSVNAYRDIFNIKNTYLEKGKIEGKIEGKTEEKKETARIGLKEGYPIEMISKMTGLTEKEINALKD